MYAAVESETILIQMNSSLKGFDVQMILLERYSNPFDQFQMLKWKQIVYLFGDNVIIPMPAFNEDIMLYNYYFLNSLWLCSSLKILFKYQSPSDLRFYLISYITSGI